MELSGKVCQFFKFGCGATVVNDDDFIWSVVRMGPDITKAAAGEIAIIETNDYDRDIRVLSYCAQIFWIYLRRGRIRECPPF